jgi:hypothetical protein
MTYEKGSIECGKTAKHGKWYFGLAKQPEVMFKNKKIKT